MAAIISVPLALFLGITAALYRNSFYDRSVNALTLTTISMPEFFVAYLLMFAAYTVLLQNLVLLALSGVGLAFIHAMNSMLNEKWEPISDSKNRRAFGPLR